MHEHNNLKILIFQCTVTKKMKKNHLTKYIRLKNNSVEEFIRG